MVTPSSHLNSHGETPPLAGDRLSRRSVARKLAYVVPAVVVLEVARPEVALGRSGPGKAKAKGQ